MVIFFKILAILFGFGSVFGFWMWMKSSRHQKGNNAMSLFAKRHHIFTIAFSSFVVTESAALSSMFWHCNLPYVDAEDGLSIWTATLLIFILIGFILLTYYCFALKECAREYRGSRENEDNIQYYKEKDEQEIVTKVLYTHQQTYQRISRAIINLFDYTDVVTIADQNSKKWYLRKLDCITFELRRFDENEEKELDEAKQMTEEELVSAIVRGRLYIE